MPVCCIVQCGAKKNEKQPRLTLHRFPRKNHLRKKWLEAIRGENINPRHKDWYVCSLHFEESCFNRTLDVMRLHEDSVPTKCLSNVVLIMGAKTPEQVTKQRTVKCDVCGRKFVNLQALISHKKFLHTKTDTSRRAALKKREDARLPKKKVIPVNMLKRVNPQTPAKTPVKTVDEKPPILAGKDSNQVKKPHFECPVCFKKFPVYFTAFRHIQKNASCCIDGKGNKVPANSTDLVKPIRVEICMSCDDETRSTEIHDCPKAPSNIDLYECLGCKQVFNGLQLFQHHVKGLHSDGAQNYFFPSRKEFTSWKKSLHEQTKVEFAQLNRQKAKEVYHCSHQPAKVTENTQLCPSMIIARTYSKGIHISYLKDHCGHTVDSTPLKQYSEYSISLYPREMELKELSDDSDLYVEFKNIIMSVAHDAAKAKDMSMLKELIGKALEMASLLKHLKNSDHSATSVKKKLSDDQISKTLDSLQTRTGKRKQIIEVKETKREVPKRIKRNSTIPEDTVENSIPTKAKTTLLAKSVTFKNTSKNNDNKSDSELSQTDTEDSLKTILTASEATQTSKKADDSSETSSLRTEDDRKDEPLRSAVQSPSFNDSYMNFVGQNFRSSLESSTPKVRPNIRKKEIMKTKIGQFKAKSLSPKQPISPKSPKEIKSKEVTKESISTKKWSTKDLKYEVKQQENDYNILILKI